MKRIVFLSIVLSFLMMFSPQATNVSSSTSSMHAFENVTNLFPIKLAKDFYPTGLTRQHLLDELSEETANITGLIVEDEIWDGVIRITGDLKVYECTITIKPGTIVFIAAQTDDQHGPQGLHPQPGGVSPPDLFNPKDPLWNESYVRSHIHIHLDHGNLIAEGTKEQPIIITSDANNPQSDDWLGIWMQPDSEVIMYWVVMEYFRVFCINSSNVRISYCILRNMMETICIMGTEENILTLSPTITHSHIYNSGHNTITVRSGSPTITHNVIRPRPDMEFPGFEYGAVDCGTFSKPTIEYNLIEGGSPVPYHEYDSFGNYWEKIVAVGLHLASFFGATVEYNTFYNCSGQSILPPTGIRTYPYNWTIKNNNFLMNTVNFNLWPEFTPEPNDDFERELLETINITALEEVSVVNNYWSYKNETQVKDSIAVWGNTKIQYKPFETSFILEALPYLLGDLNNDGTIDIYDVVTVSIAFGSTPLDPNWNILADLNNDDVVDIFDIVLLANNFGKTT